MPTLNDYFDKEFARWRDMMAQHRREMRYVAVGAICMATAAGMIGALVAMLVWG